MRKVLVVWYEHFGYLESMVKALNSIDGIEADKFELEYFNNVGSDGQKLLTKLGIYDYQRLHMSKMRQMFWNKCKSYKPNTIIVLNGNVRAIFDDEFVRYANEHNIDTILWFMDTIRGSEHHDKSYLESFKKIYTVEDDDIEYIQDNYGVAGAQYLPLGANKEVYHGSNVENKLHDISFVGVSDSKRLKVLDHVAQYSSKHNLKMVVYGQMWKQRPCIQRIKHGSRFKKKYKELYSFTVNKYITQQESAKLYQQSKVCLNIIAERHSSPNPRTFEILATGAFQLVEYNKTCAKLLENGKHLVMYNDLDELDKLLDYYLNNAAARENIAKNGAQAAKKMYLMENSVRKIISDLK